MDVLPGGGAVAYAERQLAGGFRLFQLPLTEGASPTPLLAAQFNSSEMRLSPDGRAIAFRAGPQGRDLYVAPFPVTSEPVLAATGILCAPRWSANGRQLYYVGSERRMMMVSVGASATIAQPLFVLKPSVSLLEVSRDGRFLLLVPQVRAAERPIIVDTRAISSVRQ